MCCSTTVVRVWHCTHVKVTSHAKPKARVTGSRVVATHGAVVSPCCDTCWRIMLCVVHTKIHCTHLGMHNLLLEGVGKCTKQLMGVMLQTRGKLLRCDGIEGAPQGPWVDGGVAHGGMVQHACQEGMGYAVGGECRQRVACVA